MSLSLWFGVLMLVIKTSAYILTGSSAIMSDAAESVVHVAAVAFAAYSLRLSYKPADSDHLFGHAKISFFSSGFEGAMIIIAAVFIIVIAVSKWLTGLHLEHLGLGTGLTAVAAIVNGALGFYLVQLGRKKHSIILEANGKHVLTDCWTSIGVLVGLGLTLLTGWLPWDPIFAILVALNILYSGAGLLKRSFGGLMDQAEPKVNRQLHKILDRETEKYGIKYHRVRHRNLGNAYAIELHLLFPEDTSVRQAHRQATAIESEIEKSIQPRAFVLTHLEAIEDHAEAHKHSSH